MRYRITTNTEGELICKNQVLISQTVQEEIRISMGISSRKRR